MQTFFGHNNAAQLVDAKGLAANNCPIIHVKWPISGQPIASCKRYRFCEVSKGFAKVPNFGREKHLERKSKNEIGLWRALVLNVLIRKLSAAFLTAARLAKMHFYEFAGLQCPVG